MHLIVLQVTIPAVFGYADQAWTWLMVAVGLAGGWIIRGIFS
jgi:hypothetical protein